MARHPTTRSRNGRGGGAQLELEQADIGEVWASPTAKVDVRVRNTGRESVEVERFAFGCCGSNVSPSAAVIPAGESVTLTVTLDLTPQHISEFGRLTRPFEFQLTAETASPKRAYRWAVAGTCRAALAPETPILHFGEANLFGRPPVPRLLTVLVADPGWSVTATPDTPRLRVLAIDRRADRAVIRLVPETAAARGPFSANLRLEAFDPTGQMVASTSVEVDGVVRDLGPNGRTEP